VLEKSNPVELNVQNDTLLLATIRPIHTNKEDAGKSLEEIKCRAKLVRLAQPIGKAALLCASRLQGMMEIVFWRSTEWLSI